MNRSTRRDLLTGGATLAAGIALSNGPANAIEVPKRAGGPRLKVGCCAYSFRKYLTGPAVNMDLFGFLEACARLDIDGVELTAYYFPKEITPEYMNRLKRRAFLLGIEVAGAACGGSLCFPPGEKRDKQLADVKAWIERAARLGAPELRVFAGGAPAGTDFATGRKWVVEGIEQLLPTAEQFGVVLAMENHHGVVPDADGVLAVTSAINSDWFGLKWDSANFSTADPYSDLQRIAPYAVTTHIKTEISPNGRKQPSDLPRILGLLRSVGYRGYLLLEYEAAEEPLTAVPAALATLKRLAQR